MRMERVDNFMKRAHETEVKKGGPKLTFGLLACLAVRLEDTRFRKPEPGMWDFAEARTLADGASAVDKGASFFCGDAAGRAGDFSVFAKVTSHAAQKASTRCGRVVFFGGLASSASCCASGP